MPAFGTLKRDLGALIGSVAPFPPGDVVLVARHGVCRPVASDARRASGLHPVVDAALLADARAGVDVDHQVVLVVVGLGQRSVNESAGGSAVYRALTENLAHEGDQVAL